MIENFLHTLGVGIIVVSMTISSWLGITPQIGAILPTTVANFETSLASAITSTDTSLTLTANAVRGGGSLSGYTCFTLDSGTSSDENVCGTLSGTAMTSITRGISYANGTTTVSENKFAHRRGASVKQSDAPLLLIMKAQLNGEDTISNALTLDAIATYSSALSFATQSNQLASVKYSEDYANAVIAGGTPTSTEVLGGKVELGTLAEQASSYDGGSAKPTVLQTKNSTSTCQVVGSYNIVASSTTGKIDKGCIDQTASYTFSGANTFSATTTIAASSATNNALNLNGIDYAFPSTQGASSTILMTNGAGGLTWNKSKTVRYSYIGTANVSASGEAGNISAYATSTGVTIPAGVLNASSTISVSFNADCGESSGDGNCHYALRNAAGATLADCQTGVITTSYNTSLTIEVVNITGTASQRWACFGRWFQSGGTNISGASEGTASVDLSVADTYYLVVTGNDSDADVFNYNIEINP